MTITRENILKCPEVDGLLKTGEELYIRTIKRLSQNREGYWYYLEG